MEETRRGYCKKRLSADGGAVRQQTLAGSFTLTGVGIHSGNTVRITVHPAEADFGRVFLVAGKSIPAQVAYVIDTERNTTLGRDGVSVATVEHLLSALAGCGIDNARIEVEGAEVPILDGSALPFIEAIQAVGTVAQGRPPRALTLTAELRREDGASRIVARPCPVFRLEVTTAFTTWPQGHSVQIATIEPTSSNNYAREIAPARTFAFRHEVETLLASGLAKGGSLENALIITPPDTFSTPLRLPSEWCRHKMLDMIGDFALADARLRMEVVAVRPGHRINIQFVRALVAEAQLQKNQETGMDWTLDIEEIRALMPHRYPFLLVDRILDLKPGKHVVGMKNVTINEPFFQGHFPAQAVMPGVLIIEAMAQTAGLMLLSLPDNKGKLAFIAGIEKARFRKPVVPGDTLIIEASVLWVRNVMGRVRMTARVEGTVVTECEMTYALKEKITPSYDEVFAKLDLAPSQGNGAGSNSAGGHANGKPIHESGDASEQGNEGEGDRV